LGIFIGSKFKGAECPKTQSRKGRKSNGRKIKKEKKEEKLSRNLRKKTGRKNIHIPKASFEALRFHPLQLKR